MGIALQFARDNDSALHFVRCLHRLLNAEGHGDLVDLVAVVVAQQLELAAQFGATAESFLL